MAVAGQRRQIERGAKGVAARSLGATAAAVEERAKFRSSVRRVAGKAPKDPPPDAPEADAVRRTARAEQAAAGMMDSPSGGFDEASVKRWVGGLSAEDQQKLARLVAIVRRGKSAAPPAWDRVERGLAQSGVHIDARGDRSTETATEEHLTQSSDDWSQNWARIKDFINGH